MDCLSSLMITTIVTVNDKNNGWSDFLSLLVRGVVPRPVCHLWVISPKYTLYTVSTESVRRPVVCRG